MSPETVVQVPMMRREDEFDYLLDRSLSCRVVGLPYQGNATALFVLPSEGRMEKAEAGLDQQTLTKWLKKLTKRCFPRDWPASPCTPPRETVSPGATAGGGALTQPRSCLQAQGHQGTSRPGAWPRCRGWGWTLLSWRCRRSGQ